MAGETNHVDWPHIFDRTCVIHAKQQHWCNQIDLNNIKWRDDPCVRGGYTCSHARVSQSWLHKFVGIHWVFQTSSVNVHDFFPPFPTPMILWHECSYVSINLEHGPMRTGGHCVSSCAHLCPCFFLCVCRKGSDILGEQSLIMHSRAQGWITWICKSPIPTSGLHSLC